MFMIFIRTSNQAVEDQKRLEAQLSEEVNAATIRIAEINKELDSIMEQLGEAKVNNFKKMLFIQK